MSRRGLRTRGRRVARIEWLAGLALLGCLPTTHEREPLADAAPVEGPRCAEGKRWPNGVQRADEGGSASVAMFDARVVGDLAQVEVVQTFENHSDRPTTIDYEFALRGWTLVDHAIEIADLRMRDLVVTREQAYASQGSPAIVEVVPRPTDRFARSFVLLPGESSRVELLLARELDIEGGRTTLTLPTRASGCELDVMVTLETGPSSTTPSSPTHAITSVSTERATHLALAQPESDDRDFALTWQQTDADDVHGTFWLLPDGHFTLIIEPPTHADPALAIARELIWLEGDDAPDSAEALARVATLAGLRPDDAMVVIPSDHVRHVEFERALAHHPERLRMLVLGHEAMPSDDPLADTRVFGLAGPASPTRLRLLDALPRLSRGAGVVRREGESDPMLAERFARRIASPLFVDLELDWGDARVEYLTLARLPDLFADHPLVVHGRVHGPVGSLVLHGRDRVGRRAIAIEIQPTQTTDSRGLATITALEQIDALFGVNRERLPCFPDGREDRALALALSIQQQVSTTCVVALVEQAGAPARLDPVQPRCDVGQATLVEAREPFRDLDNLGGLWPEPMSLAVARQLGLSK